MKKLILGVGILAALIFGYDATLNDGKFGAQVTNNVQGNSIDFSKIVDSATLDANFTVASGSGPFTTTWHGNIAFQDHASVSGRFEVSGPASISSVFSPTGAFIAGATTASGSSIYTAEFVSTGTTSLNLTGTSANKGTCLQLKNTVGDNVYIRVYGTTLTVTQVKCHQ